LGWFGIETTKRPKSYTKAKEMFMGKKRRKDVAKKQHQNCRGFLFLDTYLP